MPHHTYTNTTPNSKHATSEVDVLAASKALSDRGISNPQQFAELGAEAIFGTVRWFDAQAGRVGTGVLVNELRSGGKPGWRGRASDALSENAVGWQRMSDWCHEHFPDLADDEGRMHPDVFGSVWLLGGIDRIDMAEHEAWIRARVASWEKRWAIES